MIIKIWIITTIFFNKFTKEISLKTREEEYTVCNPVTLDSVLIYLAMKISRVK